MCIIHNYLIMFFMKEVVKKVKVITLEMGSRVIVTESTDRVVICPYPTAEVVES